ncbi:MAG: hypothetical protein JO111_11685 [Caulobacteraceae bacterium]|nr:hypothetical protein [Caulobacteraceae bacterium]
MTQADLAILEADAWFGQIPSDRRDVLLTEVQVRSVIAGARLNRAGDPLNRPRSRGTSP